VANTILLKRSGTAGKVPLTANLSLGELSLNYTDGRLYTTSGAAIIDLSQNDKITLSGDATGTSTNPSAGSNWSNLAVTLSSTGVTAGNYGSATSIPTIVVDAKGRVTSITSNAVSTTISLGAGSGSGSVAGGGTLTVSGGTGITTSVTGSTYTITNSGVTSAVAGTGVSVSGATGAVTFSIGQSVATTATPTFAGLNAATVGNIGANVVGTGTYLTSLNASNLSSGTVPSAQISGAYTGITQVGTLTAGSIGAGFTAIPNSALANSSITVNGTAISLGGSATITAAAGTLTGSTLAAGVTASSLTSVGTLVSLAVTGNVTTGNVSGTTVSGTTASFTNLGGTLQTAAQPNVTSVGTLVNLTVTNPISGSVTGSAATATTAGTVTTAAQPNITSVGTLTGLTVSSTITGSVSGSAATVTAASQPSITTLAGVTSLGTAAVTTTAAGNFVVAGNLTVSGTYEYVNSTVTVLQDPIIELNTGVNGAALTGTAFDSGIKTHYWTGLADASSFFGRTNAAGSLEYFGYVSGESGNVITGTYGTIKSGALVLANSTASSSTTTGALQVAGGAGIAGAVYAGSLYDTGNRVLTTATSHANSGGDVTVSGAYNALSLTLATVNTNVGTFGNATYNQGITVNGKGLITGVTTALITPAFSSLTGTQQH